MTHLKQITNPIMRTAYGAVLRVTRTDWLRDERLYCNPLSEISKGPQLMGHFENSFAQQSASTGGGG